jgi:signal transduction histidine kinase/CheY-like chemotaxis protein
MPKEYEEDRLVSCEEKRLVLGVINELLVAASASHNAHTILEQSLGILLKALDARAGMAYLHGEHACELVASQGIAAEDVEQLHRYDLMHSNAKDWMNLAQPVSLDQEDADQDVIKQALRVAGCSLIDALRLVTHDEHLGYLIVGYAKASPFSQEGRDLLHTVGLAVGLAVDNSRLYRQMEKRLREIQALYDVGSALVSTLDLDDLLTLIVRSAVGTIEKASNGVLHLLDEETSELHPRALTFVGEVRPDQIGRTQMRTGRGVAGYALETGQVVNIPDVSQDPRFVRVGQMRPFASMLVVPMRLGDRNIGTLSIDSAETHAFSPSDERLLVTLATQAAAAIQNARLVRDLQQSLAELENTHAQLIQSEKLSAVGQLIAGVAHELNNPLTAVMGYAQLLQGGDGVDASVSRDLQKIYSQAQRAAKIVQNLLTFARQHKAERQQVDVSEVLERTLELRAYQLRMDNIEVETRLAQQPLVTLADPNQLQQVFLNLINNAHDAISAYRASGHLLVESQRCGDTIVVSLADDGPGLSPQVQRHLFEPFFTTKEVGRGTGLGLSICYGIISQHGGRIWAENTSDSGARFVVELKVATESGQIVEEAKPTVEPPPKKGLVLIVEDEADLASVVERMLVQDGHRVLLASDAESALQRLAELQAKGVKPDLILSDIRMPGLGGPELYVRIREASPYLLTRLVFTTGDTLSQETRDFLQQSGRPYLPKPFGIDDLRTTMTHIFQEETSPMAPSSLPL